MKKLLSGILALCLSLTLLTACDRGGQPGKTVTAGGLTFAKSYGEVYSALTDAQKAIAERNTLLNTGSDASEPNGAGAAGEGSEGTFYSGTNVQVEGVDEGDIVKTDGKYIYILRDSEMIVMQADGEDVTDVSDTFVGQSWEQTTTEDGLAHTQEKLPTELYLADGRAPTAVVLGCTHYVFLKQTIRSLLPAATLVLDGNEGAVRQLTRRLAEENLL